MCALLSHIRLAGILAVVFLMAIAGLGAPRTALAGQVDNSDSTKRKIEAIEREIESERVKLESSKQRERSIFGEFRALDTLVALQSRKEAALENRIGELTAQMESNVREEARLNEEIKVQTRLLGRRFRAMYMAGSGSFIELALSAQSFSDLSRRTVYFNKLAKSDSNLIEQYRRNINVFRDVQKKLEADRNRVISYQKDVSDTKRELESKRAEKAELLRAAREDKDTHLKVIAELEATSRRIAGVIAGNERKEEEITRNAGLEAQRATLPRESQVSTLERRQQHEAPLNVVREPPPPGAAPESRSEAEGGFLAQRGRMCAPSIGQVVQDYGMQRNPRFGTQTFSKGIEIAAPLGAPIRATWDGEVVYSGWFNGYGNILIVSHGDHYYTLYAHASSLLKSVGQRVKQGEVIGRVGETGSLKGPRVYFEVRRGAGPLNPLNWVRVGC
jgi:septal ring factor EnvC (AmiA/AmiB activator)